MYNITGQAELNLMMTYKKNIIIEDPNHLVLSDLPFKPGEKVKIIILAETLETTSKAEKLDTLFQKTQALPSSQTITEEEIAAEIDAYRRGA
jgi:predicted DNA-binding antitoxin AbrB/MazE fold protein